MSISRQWPLDYTNLMRKAEQFPVNLMDIVMSKLSNSTYIRWQSGFAQQALMCQSRLRDPSVKRQMNSKW